MQLTAEQREKIAAGKRRHWEHVRAQEASHARLLQLLDFCAAYVEDRAAEDPLARYLAEELGLPRALFITGPGTRPPGGGGR